MPRSSPPGGISLQTYAALLEKDHRSKLAKVDMVGFSIEMLATEESNLATRLEKLTAERAVYKEALPGITKGDYEAMVDGMLEVVEGELRLKGDLRRSLEEKLVVLESEVVECKRAIDECSLMV
jgi:hypothetical protein